MKDLNFYNKDAEALKDIDVSDLIQLREIGLNDSELAVELRISKAYLSKLYQDYNEELQGD